MGYLCIIFNNTAYGLFLSTLIFIFFENLKSLEAVENAIEELPSLGFSVMRTKSIMGSMNILSQVARDVEWKASNKSISCTFSYDEFIRETKKCSKSKGDPPTAAEHQYPAAPIADAVATPFENREPIRHQVSYDSQNDDKENESDTQITNDKIEELKKVSMVELKRMCKDRDEKMTGKKSELISRLMKKRKPEILLTRSRQGQYVPKVPSCNAAILVAILLNQSSSPNGLTKDNIMMLAEETGISKDAMGGNGGWYNGWAGIKVSSIELKKLSDNHNNGISHFVPFVKCIGTNEG